MTEDKRNVLRLAKDGEGTCLDCEWGTCLFGGGKGAVCLHTGKKNINELTRCDEMTEYEKPYDYRSVVYAIEHILLGYEKDISPNLHNKLTQWKKNIQEELDKE